LGLYTINLNEVRGLRQDRLCAAVLLPKPFQTVGCTVSTLSVPYVIPFAIGSPACILYVVLLPSVLAYVIGAYLIWPLCNMFVFYDGLRQAFLMREKMASGFDRTGGKQLTS
jgi:hypothetical protein